ncbi:hypothetical protein [Phenylobacterium sp.]|uniref:hypothetical protein n=1 Tax=Phenylobacterium sp. TaxID=1871053 RepID=UPI0027304D61|nr:hypothetical protein [Phenylobacterium sp.]MDP1617366.1 hypothetical protein [Phenylobacterium sp.]MDP1987586.1 hypothetical protein [Phenylobacterium sp.]
MRMATFASAFALAGMASAAPAGAQNAYHDHQLGVLQAQQQMDRQRAGALENEFNALSAQVQTDQALDSLRAQRQAPAVPAILPRPAEEVAKQPALDLPTTPDARLEASNARVKAILDGSK